MALQLGDEAPNFKATTMEGTKNLFPNGWKTVKPYLRVVPQPN